MRKDNANQSPPFPPLHIELRTGISKNFLRLNSQTDKNQLARPQEQVSPLQEQALTTTNRAVITKTVEQYKPNAWNYSSKAEKPNKHGKPDNHSSHKTINEVFLGSATEQRTDIIHTNKNGNEYIQERNMHIVDADCLTQDPEHIGYNLDEF